MSSTSTISILVNGDGREVSDGATVADLVAALGIAPRFVAVERNEALVPRAEHAACRLNPHDRIEIVTLVGGG